MLLFYVRIGGSRKIGCWYQYLRKILQNNKLMIVKADKSKAIVIINGNTLEKKIDNFIQENNIKQLNMDPTDMHQKQIQQVLQKCNALVDKPSHRYLVNIKPTAPKVNIYIKTHKDNEPIRLAINNILAPSYKIAKFTYKKINGLLCLPYTYVYNTKNSQEITNEMKRMQIDKQMKVITLDIKDFFVNLPIQGILTTTNFGLNRNIHYNELIKHTLHILKMITK